MEVDIEVEPIGPQSLEPAIALLCQFFMEEGFNTPPDRVRSNLAAMVSDQSCWIGVATKGDAVVGVVTVTSMLYVEWGRLGEIGDLYVQPAHRNSGAGRALVEAALTWCREKHCGAVSVVITPDGETRHRLSQYYAAQGFRSTGRTIMTRLL